MASLREATVIIIDFPAIFRRASDFAVNDALLVEALHRLDSARPEDVAAVGPDAAVLCLTYDPRRLERAERLIRLRPEAAWALMGDRNGYIRELALRRVETFATSPNRLIALALRLNDWVPQVRLAALNTAHRLLPSTAPEVIAAAAPYLLRQRFEWRRWTEEAAVLDQALARADVAAILSQGLMDGRTGPLGRILTHALRLPSFDSHLTDLAFKARLATVRAVALKTLVLGRASWPVGFDWAWIDKVYGLRRRIVVVESRTVYALEPHEMIRRGLKDRSAVVRRVAADALVARRGEMIDSAALAAELMQDRDAAVRTRAEFIINCAT